MSGDDPLDPLQLGNAQQPPMALESGGRGGGVGGTKRWRVHDQGCQHTQVAAGPESTLVVHLSDLTEDLRRRILTRLPLKDAIRSGALAHVWRDIWKSRWAEPTSCRDIHLLPTDNPRKVLTSLESIPRRRLDRFSFIFDNEMLRPPQLKRFLAYAAECRVEDLHVELRRCKPALSLVFHFPLSSPLLAHLSLRNINISPSGRYFKDARPFYALEAIHLESVNISESIFKKMMALCPRLRTLDLRQCNWEEMLLGPKAAFIPPAGGNLKSITIANCFGQIRLDDLAPPSLRSFRYSGKLDVFPFFLPVDDALTDLYVCCTKPISLMTLESRSFNRACLPVNLFGLTVLTVCSHVLKMASSRYMKIDNLQSMKELQLLIFGTKMVDLADIYLFLRSCHCPNLETLFVQLPDTCDVPLEDFVQDVRIELPKDCLVNLRMVKVMNFNWRRFEVRLVCFLLSKATSLHRLLLVSLNVAPQHVPGVQVADLLLLNEALVSGRVIVSKSDYPTAQPFHSEQV